MDMNKPKYEKGDRVYYRCEVSNCLNAGSSYQILGSTHILCRKHLGQTLVKNRESILEKYLEDEEYLEPELFDEFGDKIVY